MIEIKRAPVTTKINYLLIPVTQTDNPDDFNEVLFEYNKRGYKKCERTPSGGISTKQRGARIDLTFNRWRAELLVIDFDGAFRLQFRSKISDDKDIDPSVNTISGRHCLSEFAKELRGIGIDMEKFAIKNGEEVKAKIPKPMIRLVRNSFKNLTFENVHHLDRRSSYPAGMKEYHPEWAYVIDKWFKLKERAETESERIKYKALLNLTYGACQSTYFGCKFADASKYAVERNNEELNKMSNWLTKHGRTVIMYNTDGIWFAGEPVPQTMLGKGLGDWKQDHTNCTFRAKSAGTYEFLENGKYTAVARGKRKLDDYKPRSEWEWGDIYKDECNSFKIYSVSMKRGLQVGYEQGEGLEKLIQDLQETI